jgi:hypothetical protein
MPKHYDPELLFNIFFENWDEEDVKGSIKEIVMITGIGVQTVRKLCEVMGLMEHKEVSGAKKYRDPEPVPESVRWARCPHCGKRLEWERIPFTQLWDCYCICGYRCPLPKGYGGEYEQ